MGNGLVCEVGRRLRRDKKIGGTADVPHGQGEMECHQLCVAGGLLGDEEGDGRDVLNLHPQPHVGVCQFYLAELNWP